jgi:CBS domain containing-hemolysin-like protein
MTDPYGSWIAAGIALAVTCSLSLVLGALRYYSLAKFEALLSHDPARRTRLRALLEDEDRLVLAVTVLRGIATTIGIVALTAALVAPGRRAGVELDELSRLTSGWRGWVAAGALGVLAFIALGHVVPHALGARRAEQILVRSLSWVQRLRVASAPLLWLFGGLERLALKLAGVGEEDEAEEIKDEILSAALAGQTEGVIDQQTRDVIENLIEFRDVAVGEVMTPRGDIAWVDAADDLPTMLKKALEHQFSRLPVVDRSLDRVVGVLMVKDLFRLALEKKDADLRALFRPPIFVPETKKVADLLKELRAKKTHMALVVDEYGGTSGLVTIEDLIEEIIGEIDDEHDAPERPPLRRLSPTELDLDAKLPIEELNEVLSELVGRELPEEGEVETVGGFVSMRLGKVPAKGDKVALDGLVFTVTDADERRPRRLHLRIALAPAEAAPAAATAATAAPPPA